MTEGIQTLLSSVPRMGRVEWIGVRPARREPVVVVDSVEAREGRGLTGDRFRGAASSKRQVTLIQAEHLPVIAQLLGRDRVDAGLLRRNILVSGINLLSLNGAQFTIGAAVLEGTGPCHPCSRMEETFGAGGYSAVRGHGGITARVLTSGIIHIGDAVTFTHLIGERGSA
jgi:MOSC domain-containing protein YiiM